MAAHKNTNRHCIRLFDSEDVTTTTTTTTLGLLVRIKELEHYTLVSLNPLHQADGK